MKINDEITIRTALVTDVEKLTKFMEIKRFFKTKDF
jgi:hypothetical protein